MRSSPTYPKKKKEKPLLSNLIEKKPIIGAKRDCDGGYETYSGWSKESGSKNFIVPESSTYKRYFWHPLKKGLLAVLLFLKIVGIIIIDYTWVYPVKKTYNSVVNLFVRKRKRTRSAIRLASVIVGMAVVIAVGMFLFPGLGIGLGILFLDILSGFTIGTQAAEYVSLALTWLSLAITGIQLGAVFSKHAVRFFSYIRNGDTYPEKYLNIALEAITKILAKDKKVDSVRAKAARMKAQTCSETVGRKTMVDGLKEVAAVLDKQLDSIYKLIVLVRDKRSKYRFFGVVKPFKTDKANFYKKLIEALKKGNTSYIGAFLEDKRNKKLVKVKHLEQQLKSKIGDDKTKNILKLFNESFNELDNAEEKNSGKQPVQSPCLPRSKIKRSVSIMWAEPNKEKEVGEKEKESDKSDSPRNKRYEVPTTLTETNAIRQAEKEFKQKLNKARKTAIKKNNQFSKSECKKVFRYWRKLKFFEKFDDAFFVEKKSQFLMSVADLEKPAQPKNRFEK